MELIASALSKCVVTWLIFVVLKYSGGRTARFVTKIFGTRSFWKNSILGAVIIGLAIELMNDADVGIFELIGGILNGPLQSIVKLIAILLLLGVSLYLFKKLFKPD